MGSFKEYDTTYRWLSVTRKSFGSPKELLFTKSQVKNKKTYHIGFILFSSLENLTRSTHKRIG